jgi:hypothetical protein
MHQTTRVHTAEAATAPLPLQGLAVRVLERIPELTDQLVDLILETDRMYAREGTVPHAELWASCHDNLAQLVRKLADPTVQTLPHLTLLTQVGRRRVEQGVPLESLLHAYRLGSRIIWDALREAATEAGGVADAALIEGASVIWALHEAASARITEAYHEGESALSRRSEDRRRELLQGLLDGRGREAGFSDDATSALRLHPDSRYVVCIGIGGADPVENVEAELGGWAVPSAWATGSTRTVGIIDVGDAGMAVLTRVLRSRQVGRVGVSDVVDRLDDLPAARQMAEIALATIPPDSSGVAVLTERLPEALLAGNPQVAALLVRVQLGELLDLDDAGERDLLIETLKVYTATGGSATESAAQLHCHRNTVLKRLRRFEELTGRPLSDPRTMLGVALAVAAVPLLPRIAR